MCVYIYIYIYIYLFIYSDKQQLSHKIGWPVTESGAGESRFCHWIARQRLTEKD